MKTWWVSFPTDRNRAWVERVDTKEDQTKRDHSHCRACARRRPLTSTGVGSSLTFLKLRFVRQRPVASTCSHDFLGVHLGYASLTKAILQQRNSTEFHAITGRARGNESATSNPCLGFELASRDRHPKRSCAYSLDAAALLVRLDQICRELPQEQQSSPPLPSDPTLQISRIRTNSSPSTADSRPVRYLKQFALP
jgi:hypothetical protein